MPPRAVPATRRRGAGGASSAAAPLTRTVFPAALESRRLRLDDGETTTVYVTRHDLAHVDVRLVVLEPLQRLVSWCRSAGVGDALVGGFFVPGGALALGEVRAQGARVATVAFDAPWHDKRSCLHVERGLLTLAPRCELPADPAGDLLQAGPLLVRGGRTLIADGVDPEGFSAGSRQFDADITAGRYPRAALGIAGSALWAVVCDGRADGDAGLTLAELAAFMRALGARDAINLDGGGSASLVSRGRLVNRPREEHGVDLLEGRAISTALAFLPRA